MAGSLEEVALRGLMALSPVRLASIASCRGVEARATDRTIGDFIGSILVNFVDFTPDRPVVRVRAVGPARRAVQTVAVTFQKRNGEEKWNWGLEFEVDPATGRVTRGSVRCLVAG